MPNSHLARFPDFSELYFPMPGTSNGDGINVKAGADIEVRHGLGIALIIIAVRLKKRIILGMEVQSNCKG
jgi:hypothetical protein